MRFWRVTLGLVLGLALAGTGWADTLLLQNGDRLSGKLLYLADGVLHFESPYAGALNIPVREVVGLALDAPLPAWDADGVVYEGLEAFGTLDASGTAPALTGLVALGEAPATPAEGEEGAEDTAPDDAVEELPQRWSGKIDAGFTLRSGNTDTVDSALGVTVERDNEWNVLTLRASAAYAEADDVLNTRRYKGEARWQVYPKDRFYLYLSGGAEHDTGRKLELRANVAAGLGYDVIERDRITLSIDGGLDFTHEEWDAFTPAERTAARNSIRASGLSALGALGNDLASGARPLSIGVFRDLLGAIQDIRDPLRFAGGRTDEFVTFRTSARYEQQLFENSTVSEALTVFSNLEDFGEFRLLSELAFSTPISQSLDLRIALTSEYDSNAARLNVDEWDHTLVSGLSYQF